jgi:Astacin (Peptidase family M12A)
VHHSKTIVCRPKSLPVERVAHAAAHATAINPANHFPIERMKSMSAAGGLPKEFIAAFRTKYWGAAGVRLTVGFLDEPSEELRTRILSHMNAWSARANAVFVETHGQADVRIARTANDGYWSYVGTDIHEVPANEPTMNLEAFSMQTPESEFHRVVRHETGHTLGFVHEHMRGDLVKLIDPDKAIAYFFRMDGWGPDEVRQQVLTSIEESSLLGTSPPDPRSIMCYQIPGEITFNGEPIIGGLDIDESDYAFAAKLYPKSADLANAPSNAAGQGGAAPNAGPLSIRQ